MCHGYAHFRYVAVIYVKFKVGFCVALHAFCYGSVKAFPLKPMTINCLQASVSHVHSRRQQHGCDIGSQAFASSRPHTGNCHFFSKIDAVGVFCTIQRPYIYFEYRRSLRDLCITERHMVGLCIVPDWKFNFLTSFCTIQGGTAILSSKMLCPLTKRR